MTQPHRHSPLELLGLLIVLSLLCVIVSVVFAALVAALFAEAWEWLL